MGDSTPKVAPSRNASSRSASSASKGRARRSMARSRTMACVNARIGQRSAWTVWVPLIVVAALVVSLWWWTGHRSTESLPRPTSIVATPDSGTATPDSGLATIEESRLPSQARDTLALIRAGGPYPYRQDDGVFGNREGLLPRQPSGYYREYTVVTPGSDDRGPRRIISGADGDRYWTADHYASFRQIKEGR